MKGEQLVAQERRGIASAGGDRLRHVRFVSAVRSPSPLPSPLTGVLRLPLFSFTLHFCCCFF